MDDPFVKQAKSIVSAYLPAGFRLFLFGSRTGEKHHQYSDVDLGVEGPKAVPQQVMTKIADALEESDLPVKVDVVDFSKVAPEFAQIAKQTSISL